MVDQNGKKNPCTHSKSKSPLHPIFDLKSQNWLLECKTLGNIIAVFMNHQAICEWIIKRSGDGAEKMDSRFLLDFRFLLIWYFIYEFTKQIDFIIFFYLQVMVDFLHEELYQQYELLEKIRVARIPKMIPKAEAFGDIIDLLTYNCLKSWE